MSPAATWVGTLTGRVTVGSRQASRRTRLLGNASLFRLLASHLFAVIAEWTSVVGVLVYAYQRSGSTATGIASLCVLLPVIVGAPITSRLVVSHSPLTVRRVGLCVQSVGYALAALAIGLHLPVALAVAPTTVALVALSTLRPTGAVLLPALARSTRQLTSANLGFTYCDNASALAGPLAAAALLWVGGPSATLAISAGLTAVSLLVGLGGDSVGPPALTGDIDGTRPGVRRSVDSLRARPWSGRILATIWVRCVFIGAFDVLTVLLAYDVFDLGEGGPGLLAALVGSGAVLSAAVTTVVVRRKRLASTVLIAIGVAATLCVVLAALTSIVTAFIVLPFLGAAAAMVDGLGRMLVQRSVDPRSLAQVFAVVELVAGVGVVSGSAIAQLLVLAGGTDLALYGLSALFLLVVIGTCRSLWRADETADVPVVEMSLLAGLPMFAPMRPITLEAVARSVDHLTVEDGAVVIRQGDLGDRFYAVVDGQFDVVMGGVHVRTAGRGSSFGEVALLADVPRTATVSARGVGHLLAVERVPFLTAVTGSDTSAAAAWGVVNAMQFDADVMRP